MKFCVVCGARNGDDAAFCTHSGAALQKAEAWENTRSQAAGTSHFAESSGVSAPPAEKNKSPLTGILMAIIAVLLVGCVVSTGFAVGRFGSATPSATIAQDEEAEEEEEEECDSCGKALSKVYYGYNGDWGKFFTYCKRCYDEGCCANCGHFVDGPNMWMEDGLWCVECWELAVCQ